MDQKVIFVGEKTIEEFINFCQKKQFTKFLLIADENTFMALGSNVYKAIEQLDWDIQKVIYNPHKLHADENSLLYLFEKYDSQPRLFVAVGSGTITDITRFTSNKTQNHFVSFPTAGSVDAYTSRISPLIIRGFKRSVECGVPLAIFTDIPTIIAAPLQMTSSGVADLLGKYTSTADWHFSHLIWGMDFNPEIYSRLLNVARHISREIDGIVQHTYESMVALMECQFESGSCMADFGNSSPASGGEHHISHLWEMLFQWEEREGLLHGDAVGVGSLMEAKWYEQLRNLTKDEAASLLRYDRIPDLNIQKARLINDLPKVAEELISSNPIFLQLSDENIFRDVRERILDQWHEIQTTAATVPSVDQMRGWLEEVGAPTSTAELGLSEKEARMGYEFGHYLRERFSINVLRKLFSW